MARKQVRLKDVAEQAGVAVNTASTILNRRPNSWASKATEERVFAAAKELGYRPNRAAVALQSGRFHTIGLLIADMRNPYFTHFAAVLGKMAEARGYDLVIENWRTDLAREKKLLQDFVHRNVDGVAAFLSDVDEHREFLEAQQKMGFPMVALAMPTAGDIATDMVIPNFESGLREAAGTLYELGHRRFAFLSARSKGQRVGKRPAIFQEIIKEFPDSTVEIVESGPSIDEARDAAQQILAHRKRPTAVVALNDFTAMGVLRAAKDLKLKVPEDISVVGIDGVPLVSQLTVSLSTVAMPHEEMVEKTMDLLLDRIEGDGADAPPQRAEFTSRFILRESVGAVKR